MSHADPSLSRLRAAAYVRMSTEHQQCSISHQMEVIQEYASRQGLEIVEVYSDEGKSGLNIQGRDALARLIGAVLDRTVNFGHILVYDVSRWGRFQDTDESAHYEFICREAGVAVRYCTEPFENEGSLLGSVLKNFKRAMAAEFSRQLSVRICRGKSRLIRLGYHAGGAEVMGLRRMLVDKSGWRKTVLNPGEQKSLHTDHVILVPGPRTEVVLVRWIFQNFVERRKSTSDLARLLNRRGKLSLSGRPWTEGKIRNLLNNEKYIGNLVYSRRTSRLKTRVVASPSQEWVRKDQAFHGIISQDLFFKAKELLERHRQKDNLRAAIRKKENRDVRYRRGRINRKVITFIIGQIENLGGSAIWNEAHRTLLLNHELLLAVVFTRHNTTPSGSAYWLVRRSHRMKPDLTLAVRMNRDNAGVQDFYLLPDLGATETRICLAAHNGISLDAFRFEVLSFLVGMGARVKVPQPA